MTPLTIALQNTKFIGTYLTKYVYGLYTGKHKILLKEITNTNFLQAGKKWQSV